MEDELNHKLRSICVVKTIYLKLLKIGDSFSSKDTQYGLEV